MALFDSLKKGLQKTKDSIFGQVKTLIKNMRKVDEDLLEELEELLIMSDVGGESTEIIIDRLRDTLKEKNYKLAMIVGNVSPERRDKFKNDFQAGKFNIFLINTASGQEGLTLDRAEAIIFTDAYPPVGSIEQAEDRFIATTEEKANKPHAIYYLVMKNSYDETIKHALEKRKTEAEVINDFKAQLERSQNGKS